MMHAAHDRFHWFNAHTPRLMRIDLGYWILPLSIDTWKTRTSLIQCAHTTGEVAQLMCTQHRWRVQSLADSICRSLTFLNTFHGRACRPWLMPHSVGRRLMHDKNTPWSCVQDFAEVTCHGPTLLSRSTYTTSDAYTPRFILLFIGQNLQTDLCSLETILARHI